VESLRWILLGAGFVFVLAIYILGRSRRQRHKSIIDELEEDLPEFSAQNLDDMDEGVGEVRIVADVDLTFNEDDSAIAISAEDKQIEELPENEITESDTSKEKISEKNEKHSDIVVLYILSKANQLLAGSQINSSVQAMGLTFGEMNIFHFKSDNRSVFSLANMLEPGSFDPDTIHDLKTSGLTVFMKIQGDDPLDDLTEMLQRSYQLAGLLDARLCNHKREPLTEQDAENYRTQVREFIDTDTAELTSET
jgi:cell division protein ZipA